MAVLMEGAMFAFLARLLLVARSRLKSRARLEAENLVLRQQVIVLSRKSASRVRFRNPDRLIFVWLYRFFPSILNAITVVKPETVIRWHRYGFRAYWRWKSRRSSGRPRIDREIRDLIRRMGKENPLWGAPRIHAELLMLGIEVAQSTVTRYMTRRQAALPELEDIPAQPRRWDRVYRSVRGSYYLFQFALWLGHSSSRSQAIGEHQRDEQSDRRVDRRSGNRRVSLGRSAASSSSRPRWRVRSRVHPPYSCHGNPRPPYCTALAVAERPRRAAHRIDTSRISRSPHRVRRRALARCPEGLRFVLQ
jgi:hypothetical protein